MASADQHRASGFEHSGPAAVVRGNHHVGELLAELQDEARDVFASSGETVDRFLSERQREAQREFGLPM